ncbi:ABC-type transport system involved in multi-copper enzyme maturation permease subunit [Actinoplanes campanulatus]|uniref:ABC-type transport system involved in multi-copper enzyme maturation permease subunit n=1 Tax=Actinoplanes campanulatus TaxID=113559 RepID=A0A7W5ARH0_9ACTN|nr:ABC transporter permease [Actinoplanes campanulatus]MBB3101016.1 ABC-type transport system involved in multi-copper enzyme maturation permease subunit [Actinoplanes campanulatus]GGN49235.1 ABC transporter permease [Actinoplanes campanulatus]GID41833.1 ABC transporter permease [Actinoplanes campanulatus]
MTSPTYRLTARGVLHGEWTKFWSLRSSWITLAVSVLLLVTAGLIVAATFEPEDGSGPGAETTDPVGLALSGSAFAALAVGVLGVLLSAGEYSTGMIRSTLTAVPSRLPVLWSKAAIAGGTAAVATAAGALASFLAGAPLVPDVMTALDLGDDGVLRALLSAGLYLGLVAVIGVGLGTLVRSSAGGITILAGVLLILPGLTMLLPDSWAGNIDPYLPSNAGDTIMSLTSSGAALSRPAGLAVLAGYAAITLGAAAYRLAKSDA